MKAPHAVLLTLVAHLASCAFGAPPGFSEGDRWSAPLVNGVEGDVLFVPVFFGDQGPYLFQLNPEDRSSTIDFALGSELDLHGTRNLDRHVADQNDNLREGVVRFEVPSIRVGDLTVRDQIFRGRRVMGFQYKGHHIRGSIGRDILAESLVWSIDRDRSVLYIATQGHLDPPTEVEPAGGDMHYGDFLVKARVNDEKNVLLAVDYRARWSTLWPKRIDELDLPEEPVDRFIVDQWGQRRDIDTGYRVDRLSLGSTEARGLVIHPFYDQRVDDEDYDGLLGQDFLSRYNITCNLHEEKIWLAPREADRGEHALERIRRWGGSLGRCGKPACMDIAVGTESASASKEAVEVAPGVARFTRDETAVAYDVLVEALDEDGRPLGAPLILVAFPKGAAEARFQLHGPYADTASLRVVDATPFPPSCPGQSACVGMLR